MITRASPHAQTCPYQEEAQTPRQINKKWSRPYIHMHCTHFVYAQTVLSQLLHFQWSGA